MSLDSNGNGGTKEKVTFHYIKSPSYRVIHVDGALGGVTPSGMLHFSLYSERPAIPRKVTHFLDEKGRLSGVQEIEAREGVVREMDVDAVMTLESARALHQWLGEKILEIESLERKKTDQS
jgi:hypothetical protein